MPLPIAEACLRNQAPIAECLQKLLPKAQSVLEIGSGTGQHAVFICKQLPYLSWQPTELEERIHEVEAWRKAEALENVLQTKVLDVSESNWRIEECFDTVFTANTIHYISWKKVEGLLKGASEHLKEFTSEGNKNLDAWLKQRDSTSGIKDISEVSALAKGFGLELVEEFQMPANNLILQFRKI
jgi:cyclopropane fatty-acyl-phospholipid synthase-like methyltransferase